MVVVVLYVPPMTDSSHVGAASPSTTMFGSISQYFDLPSNIEYMIGKKDFVKYERIDTDFSKVWTHECSLYFKNRTLDFVVMRDMVFNDVTDIWNILIASSDL